MLGITDRHFDACSGVGHECGASVTWVGDHVLMLRLKCSCCGDQEGEEWEELHRDGFGCGGCDAMWGLCTVLGEEGGWSLCRYR